jgi:hypothetical protein
MSAACDRASALRERSFCRLNLGSGYRLAIYNRPMAIEFVAQRLQIGDVVLIDLPEQAGEVEATVIRDIERTDRSVRATLRIEGRDDFVKEWALGEMVTIVRGP